MSDEIVTAVARALIATHAHHKWVFGSPRADGMSPLWLQGEGEFPDKHWLIAEDGTVHVDKSQMEERA